MCMFQIDCGKYAITVYPLTDKTTQMYLVRQFKVHEGKHIHFLRRGNHFELLKKNRK